MITNPKFTQMTSTLTFISRVLPQCITALCFPRRQFQPRVSLCSWPSPMPCHQKGLSSNYPGHFIQFVLITLPFPSLLMLLSLVGLSDFLDLQLSWRSFLWLAHLYSLLFARVHLWRLWYSLRLWHTPHEPQSYSSRSLRVRRISSAGISPHFLRWSVQSFDLLPTDPLCFFFNFLKFLNFFFPSQQKAENLSFYSHYARGGEVRSASCPYIGRRKSQAGKSICDQEDNWRHQDRHDTKWESSEILRRLNEKEQW